jgi:hypothetical protein
MPCVALGCPTCGCADGPCVCVVDVRCGVELVDVPCVTLGCSTCDEIQGFRVRPRWKTNVAVTKFGVSKSAERKTAHAWGVSMSGRCGNRPSTSVKNLGVSMSGHDGTRPKAQPWETRGFHVRPQRKPPKIASVENRRPRQKQPKRIKNSTSRPKFVLIHPPARLLA